MFTPSRMPPWRRFLAALVSSSRVQGGQELAALAPTSAACAWMVVVDSSTMMLPSASKVMPGAVCTSGGREGSRRSAPSLPLTFSCTQGTRLAPAFADRSPEQAAMLRSATNIAGRAWRQAALDHEWAGAGSSAGPGAERGAHACPGQGPAEGSLQKAGKSRSTAEKVGWVLAGSASRNRQAGRTAHVESRWALAASAVSSRQSPSPCGLFFCCCGHLPRCRFA